jgi:hypothetical protein
VKIDWGIKKQTSKQTSKQLWFAIFILKKRIITAFGITSDSSPHTIKIADSFGHIQLAECLMQIHITLGGSW